MKRVPAHIMSIAVCALVLSINLAQAQTQASNTDETARAQAPAAKQVLGSAGAGAANTESGLGTIATLKVGSRPIDVLKLRESIR